MALVQMVMPKMGESIMEGTILKWLKKPGESIAQDESVLEVATDKVDTEVPSTHAGVLVEVFVKEGDVVAVGAPIASIETSGSVAVSAPAASAAPVTAATPVVNNAPVSAPIASASNGSFALMAQASPGRFYSPLVLTMCREEAIDMATLERIPGSGQEGRVTKKDIQEFLAWRSNGGQATAAPAAVVSTPVVASAPVVTPAVSSVPAVATESAPVKPAASYSGQVDIIEMDRMRKIIAQRMVDSKRISPHVTSFVEADVTNIVNWRNKVKAEFLKKEGDTLTLTPIFIEAIVHAMKDYPMMNVSVDGDKIIVKKYVNIGMAVALPSGNLIVPVIKNADQLNLTGLTKKVNELAQRARDGKLTPDELSDGTFTVSNVGSFGNVMGTPIIMQPQVGIMALGAVRKKPAVIETPQGDFIGIRHMMFLSHSYDHRVVDGALGGMFVRRVADYLENFDTSRKV